MSVSGKTDADALKTDADALKTDADALAPRRIGIKKDCKFI